MQDSGAGKLQNLEQLVRVRSSEEIDPADQKIVAAVEYLLNSAFDNRASDIHIEPKREASRLRLRIDGILHDIGEVPAAAIRPRSVIRVAAPGEIQLAVTLYRASAFAQDSISPIFPACAAE